MKGFDADFGVVDSVEGSDACRDNSFGGKGQVDESGWRRDDERYVSFCHFGKEVDSGFGTFEPEGLGKVDSVGWEADRDCCGEQEEDAPADTVEDNHNSYTMDARVDTSVELSS